MSENKREERLVVINQELSARNLKCLPKLGDIRQGEIEITGIEAIFDHSAAFFTDVKFSCVFPNGASGAFTIRFNANGAVSEGVVMVVMINGKMAIVKQWRPALGRWTYELPRGFGEKLDKANIAGSLGAMKIGDLPLGTLARELGEEVLSKAEITSVTHLGNVAENSGNHSAVPANFLVAISVPEKLLGSKINGSDDEIAKVQLWTISRVRQELGRRLCDAHSLSCLALALNFIESLPRL